MRPRAKMTTYCPPARAAWARLGALALLLGSGAATAGDAPPKEPPPAPAAATVTAAPEVPPAPLTRDGSPRVNEGSPLGYAGEGRPRGPGDQDFLPIPDRWRMGSPRWRRYAAGDAEVPGRTGEWWNPYDQNVLKADYPIFGDKYFLDVTGVSDTLMEGRSFPIPSGVSTNEKRNERFFGDFNSFVFSQTFIASVELFRGDTSFRPKDFALKLTPAFNINVVEFNEDNAVKIDVSEGNSRTDAHVGFQEMFAEIHLLDLSTNYDFLTSIIGIQPFNSDFRGFLYNDNNLGLRFQSNFASNRIQLNAAWFRQLEKETNSGLNTTFKVRDQNIVIANLFVQDFLLEGYTALLSYHYNRDHPSQRFDNNGFIVRPAKVGAAVGALGRVFVKNLDVHYLGWGGDGHLGPINISHQYYFAFGEDSRSEISGRSQNVAAHFFAAEVSKDVDWLRLKASFLYASGDKDPTDGDATGFSAILDNPFFAGSGFSYYNRQGIPLVQTGVLLKNRLSLLTDLRSSKTEGMSNFVNPGVFLYGVGASARVTPKLFVDANVNYVQFAETETLEYLQVQNGIRRPLGVDSSIGAQYRPFLNENVILTGAAGVFTPLGGFRDIYTGDVLYSVFGSITLTF